MRDLGPQLRPLSRVVAAAVPGLVEPEQAHQLGEELRLERRDRQPAAIGALVHVVVGQAGVEHVHARLVAPEPLGPEGVLHRGEVAGPVDDGDVEHPAPARSFTLEQRRQH